MYHYKSTKLMSIFLFHICVHCMYHYKSTKRMSIFLLSRICVHCMYHYKSTKLMSIFLFQVYVFTVCIIISLLNSCLYFCFKYMCSLYVSL